MARSIFVSHLLGLVLLGQVTGRTERRYVILSPTESAVAAKDLPHWPRETVNGTWTLSQSDADELESSLSHIADIPFPNPAYSGSRIPHPEKYFRQYAGIVLDGHKIIFVNALCEQAGNKYATNWREHYVLVFDGGDCFWNIRYDPETKRFSELMVNGVA